MNQIKRNTVCLSLIAALASGCASRGPVSEVDQHRDAAAAKTEERGPNPGGQVAAGCGRGAFEMLRMGPLGIPFSLGILVVCMPLAAATAVVHEVVPARVNDGTGAPNFAYPNVYAGGCRWGECDWRVASTSQGNGVADTPNFAFPTSYSSGCRWGECDGRPQDRPYGGRGSSGFAYPNSYAGCNGGRWC
jgi:hypothetical protein